MLPNASETLGTFNAGRVTVLYSCLFMPFTGGISSLIFSAYFTHERPAICRHGGRKRVRRFFSIEAVAEHENEVEQAIQKHCWGKSGSGHTGTRRVPPRKFRVPQHPSENEIQCAALLTILEDVHPGFRCSSASSSCLGYRGYSYPRLVTDSPRCVRNETPGTWHPQGTQRAPRGIHSYATFRISLCFFSDINFIPRAKTRQTQG